MAIRNTLIDAYGLNSPGKNLLEHAGNHDYSGFYPANQIQNIQVNHDNINNYIHITQNSYSITGAYRYVNNIESGKIYNLSFYVYSEYSGTLRNCFETSTEIYGSNLTFNSNEWNKCWVTSKAVSKNIVFYVQNTSFKIRNIKLTECTKKDCYFFQYTDVNDELKPFVYNFKDLQTNCRYPEYFTNDNPINELISWENFKYLLKEFVEYEEWQYSDDKSYRTRNTTSIIDWCDGSNKSSVSNTEREDATIEYETPELTLVVDDIPASGGTISNGTVSYGQSKYYVYSDTRFKVTDESGVITEGLTWGDSVTAQSLGTTIKDRSIVGSLSVSTTINGKTESTTADVYQQANKIESYGIPTGRTLSVSDIPASGGTISRGTLGGTITQSCTYTSGSNGSLTNPTITSSSYSSSITADSLGTTIKGRTKIGTLIYSYVCNKRTGSVSADVYQQANEATDITYGDWSVSLSANKYTTSSSPAPAGGGTVAITSSASRSRIQNYTSGATSTLSNETATPTLSISGTGFSLSGTTVTVNNRSNVEGGQRTASVTATISGVTKSITLYQALNKITSITATGSASSYTVMNISAGGGTVTWTPTITYSSGWSGNPPSGVTISYSSSESAAIQSGNVTTWPSRGITIGPWIGSNITISAKSAYTTKAVTGVVTTGQNLNTINDISITNSAGSTPVTSVSASGGTVEIFPRLSFSSGEYQFVLDYSKLGSWSGTGTGFTVSDITVSLSTGRRIVAASRGTTIGVDRSITSTYTLNTTINGIAINKSATHKCTQAGNYVESISISGGTFSYNNISASATSASPTITGSSVYFNFTSGSKSGTAPSSTYGTYSSSASYTLESVINGFTSVSQYSGTLTSTNRGTTIGNARTSGVVTRKITVTWTPTSNYNSAGTKTDSLSLTATCTQNGNYVTSLEAVARSFSYPTIEAGATSATPSSWGGSTTFVFSSGSKTTTVPSSTYGTLSSSRVYTLGSVINGFTSVNKTTGVLTATNRGSSIGPARTSGKVTYTATMTWTPTSSYNAAGTKTVSDSSTATCTQALNTITSIAFYTSGPTPTAPKTDYPASGASYGYVGIPTYSSGASGGTQNLVDYVNYSFSESWGRWEMSQDGYWGTLFVSTRGTVAGAARSGELTCTIAGTINGVSVNVSGNLTITQEANTQTAVYDAPMVTLVVSDIPASGGTISSGTVTYSQKWRYSYTSGSVLEQTAKTSGGSVSYSTEVSAPSLGTTVKSRTSIGTLTATVTMNGKSGSGSATVYQAANTITALTMMSGINTPVTTSYTAAGGKNTYTMDATYSSGSRAQAGSNLASYIDYSFNQSWGTWANASSPYYGSLTVASRGTTIGTARTGTLTGSIKGTINGVSINKTCSATLTQAANTITSIRIVGTGPSTPLTSLSATANTPGYSAIATFSTGTEAELNNYASYVSYSFNQSWGTWTSSGYCGILTIASRGTTIGAARSGVLTCTVKGTINGVSVNVSGTLSITQALNKITTLAIIPSAGATDTTSYPTGNFAASGGTKTPTTSSRVVGTFSSGLQGYTGTAGAWYGGTLTMSRTWSMAAASGFSMNTSTGAVTASNRGTTVGAARTCNPKCVVSASFTNPSSVGGGVVKASSITDSFTLTQEANSMTREYSNLVGHISSTTWANKANYTSFWATGDYIEGYTSGATGSSGSGDVPWDSVTVGGADWVYYDSVQGALKWYDNTGLERSTTITGKIGSWTYSVKVTQKAGMTIGRLYLHVPVNVGYVEYWNIYVNSTSGGQIWSGNPEQYGSANNILKMPEECAIIVAQNGGTVSFSTTYSTATDRNYRGSISGTEQDRLADGEDVTVYLT